MKRVIGFVTLTLLLLAFVIIGLFFVMFSRIAFEEKQDEDIDDLYEAAHYFIKENNILSTAILCTRLEGGACIVYTDDSIYRLDCSVTVYLGTDSSRVCRMLYKAPLDGTNHLSESKEFVPSTHIFYKEGFMHAERI